MHTVYLRLKIFIKYAAIKLFKKQGRIILKIIIINVLALISAMSDAVADPAGILLDKVVALSHSKITNQKGFLFLSWLQMNDDDLRFVVYLDGRRYNAILDDGIETSQRAASCIKMNFFNEDPTTGCPLQFDAEYIVEDDGGKIEVSLKISNVIFES